MAQEAIDLIAQYADYEVWQIEDTIPREEFIHHLADADGLLLWGDDTIDGEVMDAAPKLKVIANVSVGYDNIDTEAATKRGIKVSNTPGAVTESTADLAFTIMLTFARRIVEMVDLTARGEWKMWGPMALTGLDVHHKTLGIIGMGRIGAAIAQRAKGFSMRVLYHNRNRRADEKELGVEYVEDIPTLLGMADFVSINVPMKSDTQNLIGAKELAAMKPTAVLVNTSRGKVLDQDALYEALKNKRIAGAAIDVTREEPISKDDPLFTLDNLIITPHIGGRTWQTGTDMSVLGAENLIAGLKGEPMPNCVNCHLLDKVD
jgi:glyoxylate reductase